MIKWIRLREICEELTGLPVKFYLGEMHEHERACVLKEGNEIEIAMNLLYCKTLEDVVDNLAHELAHVLSNKEHTDEFEKKFNELRAIIMNKYKGKEVKNES